MSSGKDIRQGHLGFTLIELMIAITLGIIIVTGVLGVFSGSVRNNTQTLLNTKMTQELRAAMEVMTNEIRRSGYWAAAGTNAAADAVNPFGVEQVRSDDGTGNACILYSYDEDKDSFPGNFDERGFRLKGGAIEWYGSNAQDGCDGNSAFWQSLTQPSNIQITKLNFVDNSTCWNTSTSQPCDPCATDNWALGNVLTYTRKITVSIKAQMTMDNTRKMDMSEVVQVRNAETGIATVAGPNDGITYCGKKIPMKFPNPL